MAKITDFITGNRFKILVDNPSYFVRGKVGDIIELVKRYGDSLIFNVPGNVPCNLCVQETRIQYAETLTDFIKVRKNTRLTK